jgi:3',5'-cyclic-AMP phosphodiesterase
MMTIGGVHLAMVFLAATILLAGCQSAASRGPDKPDLIFAIVSDTHLAKAGAGDPAQLMAQAVAEINASPAEMTFFLGDLVDSGGRHEPLYTEWSKLAAALKKPFYAVPGNHDPAAIFTKHVRPQTDDVIDAAGYRFIFFADASPESHDGAVTPAQLRWLATQVDRAVEKNLRVILCTHIPRHPSKDPDMGWYIRQGDGELADLLRARAGTIVAVLSGHLHSGVRVWSDVSGVQEVVAPSLLWNFDKDFSTAGGLAMQDKRPSWLLAELRGRQLTLRLMPLGAESKESLTLDLPAVRPPR